MKIFLSHSHKHKPLVREIKSYLPEHLNLWLDEKELLIGDNISTSIQESIHVESDYLVFFIDNFSINSEWVNKEISWALDKENETKRVFILPLVLEKEAWDSLKNTQIKNRKCIFLNDYSESSIKLVASSLISELFAWLSRDLNSKSQKNEIKASELSLLENADHLTAKIADKIRLITYPFRKSSPLPLEKLLETLQSFSLIESNIKIEQFNRLLNRLQQQGYLAGLICDGEVIYIAQEHYAWKTAFYTETKKKLAKKAVGLINSGDIVAIDAGSTTFEIARQICQEVRFNRITNLKIITNSIPAANILLELASEIGLEDRNNLLSVYITGGRVRPNSLAVVTDESYLETSGSTDFDLFLKGMGGADISFIGANGIYSDQGFAVHNEYEIKSKKEILRNSKKRIVVADPSKFLIKEDKLFLPFTEDFTILTYKQGHEGAIEYLESLINNTNINIIYS